MGTWFDGQAQCLEEFWRFFCGMQNTLNFQPLCSFTTTDCTENAKQIHFLSGRVEFIEGRAAIPSLPLTFATDPEENHNIAKANPPVVEELATRLKTLPPFRAAP